MAKNNRKQINKQLEQYDSLILIEKLAKYCLHKEKNWSDFNLSWCYDSDFHKFFFYII